MGKVREIKRKKTSRRKYSRSKKSVRSVRKPRKYTRRKTKRSVQRSVKRKSPKKNKSLSKRRKLTKQNRNTKRKLSKKKKTHTKNNTKRKKYNKKRKKRSHKKLKGGSCFVDEEPPSLSPIEGDNDETPPPLPTPSPSSSSSSPTPIRNPPSSSPKDPPLGTKAWEEEFLSAIDRDKPDANAFRERVMQEHNESQQTDRDFSVAKEMREARRNTGLVDSDDGSDVDSDVESDDESDVESDVESDDESDVESDVESDDEYEERAKNFAKKMEKDYGISIPGIDTDTTDGPCSYPEICNIMWDIPSNPDGSVADDETVRQYLIKTGTINCGKEKIEKVIPECIERLKKRKQ